MQLDQLSAEKAKLHSEKVDLENQLEAEQVCAIQLFLPCLSPAVWILGVYCPADRAATSYLICCHLI